MNGVILVKWYGEIRSGGYVYCKNCGQYIGCGVYEDSKQFICPWCGAKNSIYELRRCYK